MYHECLLCSRLPVHGFLEEDYNSLGCTLACFISSVSSKFSGFQVVPPPYASTRISNGFFQHLAAVLQEVPCRVTSILFFDIVFPWFGSRVFKCKLAQVPRCPDMDVFGRIPAPRVLPRLQQGISTFQCETVASETNNPGTHSTGATVSQLSLIHMYYTEYNPRLFQGCSCSSPPKDYRPGASHTTAKHLGHALKRPISSNVVLNLENLQGHLTRIVK